MAKLSELKKLDRPQLDRLAIEKGVDNPHEFDDEGLAKELQSRITPEEVQALQSGGVEDAPASPPDDAVKKLADSKNRTQLERLAKKEGVADPKSYPNKGELAAAIFDAGYEPAQEKQSKEQVGDDEAHVGESTTTPLPVIGGVGPVIEVPKDLGEVQPVNALAGELAGSYSRKQLANLAGARGVNNANDVNAFPNSVSLANEIVRTGYDSSKVADTAAMGMVNNVDEPAPAAKPKGGYDCSVCEDTGLEPGVPSALASVCPNCGGTPADAKKRSRK